MRCSYLLLTSDFIGLAVQITYGLSKTNNDVLLVMEVSIAAAMQASLLSSLVLELPRKQYFCDPLHYPLHMLNI